MSNGLSFSIICVRTCNVKSYDLLIFLNCSHLLLLISENAEFCSWSGPEQNYRHHKGKLFPSLFIASINFFQAPNIALSVRPSVRLYLKLCSLRLWFVSLIPCFIIISLTILSHSFSNSNKTLNLTYTGYWQKEEKMKSGSSYFVVFPFI